MKQHHLYLIMAIGLTALAAASGGCGAWEKKNPTAQGPQAVPANSFVRAWSNRFDLRKDVATELHLGADTLFLYTKDHLVYGVDRAGGNTKYLAQPTVSGGVLHAPLVLGDFVIFPSGSSIDILTSKGRPARTIDLDKPVRSGAVGDGSTIYVGLDHTAGTGTAASIDVTRPYKVINWELMTFGAVSPTPAIHNRIIYIGSEDGRLYAVTDERGPVWSLEQGSSWFQTQGQFVSDIKADELGVYAANTDSKLYCLDPQSGRIRWQYYGSGPLKTAPVVTPTMVYQYVPGQGIVAIDKLNGQFNRQAKWMVKNAKQFLSEDEQHAYLLRRDNHLIAVNKQSGQVSFTSKSSAFEIFVTNPNDSTIYAATKDGKIAAIRPVLTEGEVGIIVSDIRPQPLAAAQ